MSGLTRREIALTLGMALVAGSIAFAAAGFGAVLVPDTAGYLQLLPWPEFLAQQRTPVYGLFVALLGGVTLVPLAQLLLFTGAVLVLMRELARLGLSRTARMANAFALLGSNLVLLMTATVHPEVPAAALGLVALAAALRLAQPAPARLAWLALGAGAVCYLMRPVHLPIIAALPLLALLVARLIGAPLPWRRLLAMVAVLAAPFVIVAGLRSATVGDANIVSFGGFQMSGMAALMLDEAVVARLDPDVRPLAQQILEARRAAEERGAVIGIPRNASGSRSFPSAALGYFDVLARTHDEVLYGLILPLRQPGEAWVAFNARLMGLSLAVVRAAPERWAVWIIGAGGRLIGRTLTANLPVSGAIALVALVWVLALAMGRRLGVAPPSDRDVPVLALLAATWLGFSGVLTVLVTFPATRYADVAGLLLGPLCVYGAARLLARPACSGGSSPVGPDQPTGSPRPGAARRWGAPAG